MEKSTKNEHEEEARYISNNKYITIAILATSVAVMGNLLQVNVADSTSLKWAVLLFSIVIPYLVWDVYFLNLEKPDGQFESKLFSYLRPVFWFLGGLGIGLAFNHTPNITGINTVWIFVPTSLIVFVVRFLGVAYKIKNSNK